MSKPIGDVIAEAIFYKLVFTVGVVAVGPFFAALGVMFLKDGHEILDSF